MHAFRINLGIHHFALYGLYDHSNTEMSVKLQLKASVFFTDYLKHKIVSKVTQKTELSKSSPFVSITFNFFCKQSVYKQLALGCQIAKQLSGLKSLSLSNNKNYRLKNNEVFPL